MRIWQSQPPSWLPSLPNGFPATLRVSVRTDSNNCVCRRGSYPFLLDPLFLSSQHIGLSLQIIGSHAFFQCAFDAFVVHLSSQLGSKTCRLHTLRIPSLSTSQRPSRVIRTLPRQYSPYSHSRNTLTILSCHQILPTIESPHSCTIQPPSC